MSAAGGSVPQPREVRSARFPSSPGTGADARRFVVDTMRGWRVDPDTVDDAELVVSELVSNAVLHGHAPEVTIDLADHGAVVRLEVSHHEFLPHPPPRLVPLTVSAQATRGRGLAIVDVLASTWGVREEAGERRVWTELVAARAGLLPAPERDDAITALASALDTPGDPHGIGLAVAAWAHDRVATAFAGLALPVDVGGDEVPRDLRLHSVDPLPAASARRWERFRVDTDAPVAAAFRERRPYFHESRSAVVAGFPDLGPALAASHLVALAHLPLLRGGRPVGTLALAWSHGREFDAGERSWLEAVAAVIAAALVRAGADRRDDALTDGPGPP